MWLRHVVCGLLTYIPPIDKRLTNTTGGTSSARYCYSVWLRHLIRAGETGLSTQPKVVAELGPGDSLGIGLAALVSGSSLYYALDIVPYAATQTWRFSRS